jgi:hypothetical protein
MCCRANYVQPGVGHLDGSDSCVFALNVDAARDNPESLRKNKMYLFDNMAEYIRDFVSPLYLGKLNRLVCTSFLIDYYVFIYIFFLFIDSFKCITFSWAPRFSEATAMTDAFLESDEESLVPNALIMNMGLHSSMDDDKFYKPDLLKLVKSTNALAKEKGVKMMYHSPTYVNVDAERFPQNLEVARVEGVAAALKEALPSWTALDDRYLDLYNYSKTLTSITGTLDSI